MNILSELLKCTYPISKRDYIINAIFELKQLNSNLQISTKTIMSNDCIIVAKFPLNIPFKERFFIIPILICFGIDFPTFSPEIYLEISNDLEVNKKCLEVNLSNLLITVNSLKFWNSKSRFNLIIAEIVSAFSKNFPVFKQSKLVNLSFDNKNIQPKVIPQINYDLFGNNQPIIRNNMAIECPLNKIRLNSVNNILGPNLNKLDNTEVLNDKSTNQIVQVKNKEIPINEDDVKSFFILEIKQSLIGKIREEMKVLQTKEERLNKYKNNFINQNKYLQDSLNMKDIFIEKYQKVFTALDDNIKSQNSQFSFILDKANKDQDITQVMDNFLNVNDKKLINILCVESCNDELLSLCKKIIEKNIMSFNEVIRFIRNLSRTQFKIKMYQEKLLFCR